jgi:tetraacyldisaccharide 4'-kinase
VTRLIRWPLLPLAALHGAALAWKDARYRSGAKPVQRLAWPLVSIGNLSVGGAGKTPFTIMLARALVTRGWSVDVLSRGYGRESSAVEPVDATAEDPARRYGDEPSLIARSAGVPVFVGSERAEAGRLAESTIAEGAQHVHLLDDGMQHRLLARAAEIVLLHRSDVSTALLPAGRLREPLTALSRADFLVLRNEDAALEPRVRRFLRTDAQIWLVRRQLELPVLPGAAVGFSAIAHPQEFVVQLRAQGATVAAAHHWRDHHRFTDADLKLLVRLLAIHGATCFVTTEKDAVRLTAAQRARLEAAAPLLTAVLRVALVESEQALQALETRLAAHLPRPLHTPPA